MKIDEVNKMNLKCKKCKKDLLPEEEVFQVRRGYMIPTDEGSEFEPEEEILLQHASCVKSKRIEGTVSLVPYF